MSSDPVTAIIDLVRTGIDKAIPDAGAENKRQVDLFLETLKADVSLAVEQIKLNAVEAASNDPFASRWRPFTGWICGFALCYAALIDPFMRFIAQVIFAYTGSFPTINTDITMQILVGLLGLGGFRTYEKTRK